MSEWDVWVSGSPMRVTTFRHRDSARRHARKHFLRVAERWDELRPAKKPGELRERLSAEPEEAVLDEAASAYEEVTKRESASHGCTVQQGWHRTGAGADGFQALRVATPGGVFCAFRVGAVSGLVTSMRPLPARRGQRLTAQHFRDEARRKVMKDF